MAKTPKTAETEIVATEVAPLARADGRFEYIVTDKAPAKVATRPVETGATIWLTPAEALAEVLAGHVRPVALGASRPEKPVEPASNEA